MYRLINKIMQWSKTHIDYLLHFLISLLLCLYISIFGQVYGIVITFAVGVVKEIIDYTKTKNLALSIPDLVADMFGILAATLPIWAINNIL